MLPVADHQAAALQRTGNQVGGQGCAGAGEIAGWAAEAGRDQGCVLAPVHIGIFPLIDRLSIAGGPAEPGDPLGRPSCIQRAGLTNTWGASLPSAERRAVSIGTHLRSLSFLNTNTPCGSQDDDYTADQQRHLQGGEIHASGRCAVT